MLHDMARFREENPTAQELKEIEFWEKIEDKRLERFYLSRDLSCKMDDMTDDEIEKMQSVIEGLDEEIDRMERILEGC